MRPCVVLFLRPAAAGGPWRAVSAAKLLLARADAVLLRAYQVLLVVFG